MTSDKENNCACEGKYPNFQTHSKERCFTEKEECCDHFALYRVCNEDDNLPLEVKNSRTLCRPEYVKAFIREVVKKTKAEAEQRVLEIKEKLK